MYNTILIHWLEMESDSSRTALSSALAEGSKGEDNGRTLAHVVYVWYTLCTCGTHCVRVVHIVYVCVMCMCNAGTRCVCVRPFPFCSFIKGTHRTARVGVVGRYEPFRKRASSDITGGRVPLDV